MARIVHGFRMVKHRYYIPTILFGIAGFLGLFYFSNQISATTAAELFFGLGLSLYRLLAAYFISLFIALLLAILIGQNKIGNFLIPIFDLLQNLPSFALIPIFISLFGYTNIMVITFAASSILWPILFYVLHALKTSRTDLNDAATIFGARGLKRDIYYLLPLSFSSAVVGSIVGISIGWEAIIGIEIIGLSNGIGGFLNNTFINSRGTFTVGILSLLLVVFIINRLIWMPLLKKSQLYAE